MNNGRRESASSRSESLLPKTINRLALIALLVMLLAAAPARADRIDRYIQRQMKLHQIPGLSLAVVRHGRVVKERGYGLANVELKVSVAPETGFEVGSITKTFTAALVLLLVQDGKLSLDDRISKWLPGVPSSWAEITVRNLLNHTSGLGSVYSVLDMRKDYTDDDLAREAESVPIEFKPGSRWEYCNTGYILLGVIIHKVTGRFYGDLLHDRIFEPLHMETAGVITNWDIVPNRAAGYQVEGGVLKNQDWVSPSLNMTGQGSLYMTAPDLVKWDAALSSGAILDRQTLDEMWTPAALSDGTKTSYGLGWNIGSTNGHRLVDHSGEWQGFSSYFGRYVDDGLSVVVLTNVSHAPAAKIGRTVAGLYEGALTPPAVETPPPASAIPDTVPGVTALVKSVLLGIQGESIQAAPFTFQMWENLFPDRSRALGRDLKQMGEFHSLSLLERPSNNDGSGAYRYRAVFGATALLLHCEMDAHGKIGGFGFAPE